MSHRPLPNALATLLEHPGIWRADDYARSAAAAPSGFPALDACLPGGGWPEGALTEIFAAPSGIGELGLLMPLCARITSAGRWVAFIAPPHVPYAPAFAAAGVQPSRLLLVRTEHPGDRLWALEQCLRSRQCGATLAWPPRMDPGSLRRLQLACEHGGGSGFLFLPEDAARNASTAALRLQLSPGTEGELDIRILKRRGSLLPRPVRIPRPLQWATAA